jgi:hypothetical protein
MFKVKFERNFRLCWPKSTRYISVWTKNKHKIKTYVHCLKNQIVTLYSSVVKFYETSSNNNADKIMYIMACIALHTVLIENITNRLPTTSYSIKRI